MEYYLKIAKVMRMLTPHEDLIVDGALADGAIVSSVGCIVSAIGVNDSYLIGITPTNLSSPISLEFQGTGAGPHVLFDLASKKERHVPGALVKVVHLLLTDSTVYRFAPLKSDDDTAAPLTPASTCDGKIRLVAVATTGPTAEQAAASMLAAFLGRLAANGATTAPPFPIVSPLDAAGKPHVAVGAEAAAALGLPVSDLADLGQEGFVLSNNRTAGIRASCAVVLAGASNRSQLTRNPPRTF